eukprot:72108-Pleurochrysis_carterae.AAC.1
MKNALVFEHCQKAHNLAQSPCAPDALQLASTLRNRRAAARACDAEQSMTTRLPSSDRTSSPSYERSIPLERESAVTLKSRRRSSSTCARAPLVHYNVVQTRKIRRRHRPKLGHVKTTIISKRL